VSREENGHVKKPEQFKVGDGLYAYSAFTGGFFLPMVMSLRGYQSGVVLVLLLVFSFKLLGPVRWKELLGGVWVAVSLAFTSAAVANNIFLLGLTGFLQALLAVVALSFLPVLIRASVIAYKRGDFGS
jgi:hypothetical protein